MILQLWQLYPQQLQELSVTVSSFPMGGARLAVPFVLEMMFFAEAFMVASLGVCFSYSFQINLLALTMENGAKQWWAMGQKMTTLLQS